VFCLDGSEYANVRALLSMLQVCLQPDINHASQCLYDWVSFVETQGVGYGFSHGGGGGSGGSGAEKGGRSGLLRQFHTLERSTGVELYDRMVMGRRDHVSCDEVCRDVEVRFVFFLFSGMLQMLD
jgi:hypothetical protein